MSNTETPAEIDARLAEAEYHLMREYGRIASVQKTVERFENEAAAFGEERALRTYCGRDPRERLAEVKAEVAEAIAPHVAIRDECEAEFKARGGWSRYFLVCNTGGHVHKTRHCASCFITTEFVWLPGASGQDSAGLIEMFGSKVCSVCFPEAPLDELKALEKAAKKDAEAAAGYCEGHGRFAIKAELRKMYKHGTCPVCGDDVGCTSTGKIRKHKKS